VHGFEHDPLNQANLIDGEGVTDEQRKGLNEQRRSLRRAAAAQETTTDLSLMAACLSFC